MPEVVSTTKASSTDELRLKNYRTQVQNRGDAEIREIEKKHEDEVQRLLVNEADQLQQLRGAYDVQISREAEALDEKLQQVREESQARVSAEKRAGDSEFMKVKAANQQRIDEYKKNSEAQLDALRKQSRAASENLHEKALKSAKREKEVSGA